MRSLSAAGVLFIALLNAFPSSAQTAAPPPADCPEMARALQDLLSQDARLRDWAQLARYREADRTLAASGDPVDVVFLGDSITDFWDAERFPTWFANKHYVNRGISGQTTPQMLVRLKPDVLALKPRAVVLLAGTNDIAGNTGPASNEDIQQNIEAIAELLAAHDVKLVLSSITPISSYHVKPGFVPQTTRRPMARIKAMNDWIRKYAAAHGQEYLDYFSAMVDDSGLLRAELSDDDLHPNQAGYKVMAPLAEAAIARALR